MLFIVSFLRQLLLPERISRLCLTTDLLNKPGEDLFKCINLIFQLNWRNPNQLLTGLGVGLTIVD